MAGLNWGWQADQGAIGRPHLGLRIPPLKEEDRMRLHRPSPAMVVAAIALFVALSGAAVAGTTALINGSQIKDHTIALSKLTPAAVATLRGRPGPAGHRRCSGAAGNSRRLRSSESDLCSGCNDDPPADLDNRHGSHAHSHLPCRGKGDRGRRIHKHRNRRGELAVGGWDCMGFGRCQSATRPRSMASSRSLSAQRSKPKLDPCAHPAG